MEKMNCLDDFEDTIDEVEVGKLVNKLNLPSLDLLAIAAAVVERRGTTEERHHQKRKTTTDPDHEDIDPDYEHDDDDDDDGGGDDDYEADLFKHERRLKRKKGSSSVSNVACSPRKKLKTHVNGDTYSDDAILRENRLRREKALKKPIIVEDTSLPLLKQGLMESGSSTALISSSFSSKKKKRSFDEIGVSDSLSKQERLKREKVLKKPMNTTPLPPKPKKAKNSKKKKTTKVTYKGPEPPPGLPDGFKTRIAEMGGTEIQLVIQKPLYETDISPTHCRLSMPLSQIRAANFLTEQEYAYLSKQSKGNIPGMDVGLIDTRLQIGVTSLKRWNLKRDTWNVSAMYVLTTTWNDLVDSNELECGNIVQVWSFRVDSELHFALVLVEKGKPVDGEGNSGSTDTGIGSSSSASQSQEDTQ